MPQNSSKKAVMIIAFNNFKDEEYFVVKEILGKAGVEVMTASNKKGAAIGIDGGAARVDFSLDELKIGDYQAIIFVGGSGCFPNLDNQSSYWLAQEAIDQNKILAAICAGPVILAKAGVLKDKRATVWSNILDKSYVEILKKAGAIYRAEEVVVDGQLITANGPAVVAKFGQAIVQALTNFQS